MKPAKSFVVEIKRNGRRQVVRQEPLWDPKQLKSAMHAVEEFQRASEIDSKLTQGK